jgi:hypothetical protein
MFISFLYLLLLSQDTRILIKHKHKYSIGDTEKKLQVRIHSRTEDEHTYLNFSVAITS